MKLQSKKGSTLVLVTIVLAVLTILACMLMETVFQNYKISKASGYMDYSYYAAESAIQKCCDLIKAKCDSFVPDSSYSSNNKEAFSKKVVSDVLKNYVNDLNIHDQFKDLTVSGDITDKADVAMKIEYMGYKYDASKNPNAVFITLGITADSSYDVPLYTTGNKRAFAQKEFEVRLPKDGFKLKGPIYSIGDLIADNSDLSILGDVHVYGTSPENMSQPEQYYYGGIYAKNSALIKIKGNAYSRSFIRTGEYSSVADNSSIHIYKDAIAQGIHGFGKNDNIVVMRNAYTFDDLELNGEDSVIAVNGSYFGLSDGSNARHHDDSSAIVNSAVIHYANSLDSQKSRIVVNGAVMVGGGTWKLDPYTGNSWYQIEDASVAWLSDGFSQGAAYKSFPENNYIDPSDPDDHPTVDEYIDWLKSQNTFGFNTFGFCNLFQVWSQDSWNLPPANITTSINALINKIRTAAQNGSSNNMPTSPVKISGFCNYGMAANDGMFYIDKTGMNAETESQIKRAAMLKNKFEIDNLSDKKSKDDWNTFWNLYLDGAWSEYYTGVPSALNELKTYLMDLANIFLVRSTYANQDASDPLKVKHTEKTGNDFNTLLESLEDLKGTNKYIIEPEAYSASLLPTQQLINPGNLSDPLYPFNTTGNNKYYLIFHDDPDTDLELNGTTFNGIIFTTGRVILRNGAKVNGAIIAAGRGYDADESGYIKGSAADIDNNGNAYRAPTVKDPATCDILDSGGFAAVYSEGNVSVNFPREYPEDENIPDPDAAREELLQIFITQDPDEPLDLYAIF